MRKSIFELELNYNECKQFVNWMRNSNIPFLTAAYGYDLSGNGLCDNRPMGSKMLIGMLTKMKQYSFGDRRPHLFLVRYDDLTLIKVARNVTFHHDMGIKEYKEYAMYSAISKRKTRTATL